MLILERKQGEAVDLVDRRTGRVLATVKILAVSPEDVVRVGFDAQQDVQIKRDNIRNDRPQPEPNYNR